MKMTSEFTSEILFNSCKNAFQNSAKKLNIIHFNDVYNVEPRTQEPVGGASRFLTVLKKLYNQSPENTLVFFSGDAFSPSLCKFIFHIINFMQLFLNICLIYFMQK